MSSRRAGECLFDASAVLAYLHREPGHEGIARRLDTASQVVEVVDALGLEVIPFEAELAYRAAQLRVRTRAQGLSLADRACLALGEMLGMPVITTDRSWAAVKCGVPVEVAR